MSARSVTLAAVAALVPLALPVPATATVGSLSPGNQRVRVGAMATAVWHERGDILCVHAEKRDAMARFRTPGGRVVQATDFAGGDYWSCSPNLDVPEDDRVRLTLSWKYLGVDSYAKRSSVRITT